MNDRAAGIGWNAAVRGWAVVAGLAATACAAATPSDVKVGFAGVYRTGSWTPLVVEFSTESAAPEAVCVWVEDPDGQYVRSPAAVVTAGADARRRARLTVRFGRPTARVLVEEVPAGTAAVACDPTALARRAVAAPIPSSDTVLLVLGDLPAAERASRLLARDDGTRPRVVAIDLAADAGRAGGAAAELGRSADDFDGADSIIVCGRAVSGLDPATLHGIDDWVRQGGRLVFAAGGSASSIQHSGTVAAAWLPGPIAKMLPLRRGNAIETYARASRPLEKGALAGLEVPLLENARTLEGSVEAFEGRGPTELPLVVRRAHGFGTVTWIGIDIDQQPFRNWSGSDSLLVELLGERGTTKRADETQHESLDLAGQLRQAIDQFPGVAVLPFELIAGLGLLYVACLYPLDWWIVSRLRPAGGGRRAWLSWLSLPLLVAALSVLAWWSGHRWKGTSWRTSAAELIDLDVASGLVRGQSFAGIWSPVNAVLDLAVSPAWRLMPVMPVMPVAAMKSTDQSTNQSPDPGPASGGSVPPPEGVVTWFAARGRGIGGTDAGSPHPSLAAIDYGYADSPATLQGIPIAASSSRLFEAQIVAVTKTPAVESNLEREGQGTLRGKVTSRLPFPLDACVLAHAGWLYDVGRLDPGQAFDPAAGRGPRSLAGALTRRTASRDREINVRWDLTEHDPTRILEVAGFHAAAGGSGYTSLEPGRLARFDLSPLLPLDRAVLVGHGPSFVDWQCRVQAIAGTSDTAAVPPMPGTACLWRIVIPLAQPTVASAPLLPPDAP